MGAKRGEERDMEVGIGLPTTVRGVDGTTVRRWAERGEELGFSTLGTLDRIVYPNMEPLVSLAAAAAVTDRIRLTTSILIVPYRGNAALMAKQAATIDVLSDGRLVLGVSVGGREDDYKVSRQPFDRRGRIFDQQIEDIKRMWRGEAVETVGGIGPSPVQVGGPPLLVGGRSEASVRRAVEHGAGYISGGGGPDIFRQMADKVRAGWHTANRAGEPRLLALSYFSLGPDATSAARSWVGDYYSFLGPMADQVASGALTDPAAVGQAVSAFSDAGCDELILFPCSADLTQVDLLADALQPIGMA